MCGERSYHDALDNVGICTKRYEWTSSMEAKDARMSRAVKICMRRQCVDIVYILNQEWMFGDMTRIDGSNYWKMTNK